MRCSSAVASSAPGTPRFNSCRASSRSAAEIDFCSVAALAISRSIFRQVGLAASCVKPEPGMAPLLQPLLFGSVLALLATEGFAPFVTTSSTSSTGTTTVGVVTGLGVGVGGGVGVADCKAPLTRMLHTGSSQLPLFSHDGGLGVDAGAVLPTGLENPLPVAVDATIVPVGKLEFANVAVWLVYAPLPPATPPT